MKDFFLDFLKELNSSANKHTIVLAVILGLLSGFLPTFTLLNYVIWFFVLILRIPLGLYLASFSFFGGIAYFLDPLFNKVGYFILTCDLLKPLWIKLYNTPFLRWSGFNNTLVMGSLVVGLGVSVVLYPILLKGVKTYRSFVFSKLSKIKYLSWLVPQEKKSIFRISGFVAIGAFVGMVLVVFTLLTPLIAKVLSFFLSKSLHQEVVVRDLKIKPFEVSMRVVAQKFDAKRVDVRFDGYYLMWRKFKIEGEGEVFTKEELISLVKKLNSTPSLTNKSTPKFNLKIDYSKIFRVYKFKSLEAAKKLKKDYQKVKEDIKNINLPIDKIKEIQEEIKSIDKNDILKASAQIKKIKSQIDEVLEVLKKDKKLLQEDKELLRRDLEELREALKQDYAFIDKELEYLKEGNLVEFSKAFLAPKIAYYVEIANNLYEKIKPYLHTTKKEEIKVIPRDGIYIHFEDKIKYPDVVIAKLFLRVDNSLGEYKFRAFDIANNQLLLGKKGRVFVSADTKFYKLNGKVSYFKDVLFDLRAKDVKVKKIDFDEIVLLDNRVDLNVSGSFKSALSGLIEGAIFPSEVKSKHFNIGRIDKILFEAVVEDNKITKVSSNLDELLKKNLEKLYQKEATKVKKELSLRVESELREYNLSLIDAKLKDVKKLEDLLKSLKKEAVKKLKGKEEKIKNKLREKLKNIL